MKIDPGDYSKTVNVKRAIQSLDRLRKLAFKTGYQEKLSDQSPGEIARCCAAWLTMNDIDNVCTGTFIQTSIDDQCILIEVCPTNVPTKNSLKEKLTDCKHIVTRSLHQFLTWFDNNF